MSQAMPQLPVRIRRARGVLRPALALVLPMGLLSGCHPPPGSGPSALEAQVTLAAGDHVFELTHAGRDRRYVVHVPSSVRARPAVMVALHGGGGTAAQFKDENGLDAVSEREGFLAVYPAGTGPIASALLTWNAGFNCCGYALDQDVDDVGFLEAMLDDLADRIAYDPGRVYVTGHSNGAIMAYRLAAEAADRVAAIVPVAGAMALRDPIPSRGVAILHIHSVDDPRALYDGGEGPPFPGTRRTVVHEPVTAALAFWVALQGCDPDPEELALRTGTGRDRGQTLTHLRWRGCREGSVVEHMRLAGVGHGWPGVRTRRLLQRLMGPPTGMIDASEEAWAFASRFRR